MRRSFLAGVARRRFQDWSPRKLRRDHTSRPIQDSKSYLCQRHEWTLAVSVQVPDVGEELFTAPRTLRFAVDRR
jgi:hypothetical protein